MRCLAHLCFSDLITKGIPRGQGKILFGVLLNYEDGMEGEDDAIVERWLKVGQEVYPST